MRSIDKTIRTVGRVTLDETKVEQIHTKFSGWIDKLYVDYTLEHVKKGDPLFSIYSPELVSTQQEYLLALRSKEILSGSEFSDISGGTNSLLDATKKRLELWDISEGQIRELGETGKVKESLVIYSPVSGVVTEKNVFENMYVEPGTNLYTIADHSDVWVEVDIYENEIPLVKPGDHAVMTLQSFPGEEFHGKVAFMPPHLDTKTRTVKARLEFPNPGMRLLPEMYADVSIDIPLGEKLAIPESAVLRTGKQDVVFVDRGGGNMEIKRVELGQKSDGYYEVIKGLSEGERVVTRANFLIDSESKIQAAVASWEEGEGEKESMGSHEGHNPGE
jgi:multidrug efflux pump subunit AcrA (membrane-fusion protein)